MITCPECGQTAPDDARFCDRCGQGLAKSGPPKIENALQALKAGAVVHGEFRVIEVIGRSVLENRYRAEQITNGATPKLVQLRERPGPTPAESSHEETPGGGLNDQSTEEHDPNGPRARTAELKPPPSALSARDPVTTEGAAAVENASPAGPNGVEPKPAPTVAGPSVKSGEADKGAQAANGDHDAAAETDGNDASRATALDQAAAVNASGSASEDLVSAEPASPSAAAAAPATSTPAEEAPHDDLGDLFGRVLALSLTINHPAFQRTTGGFADNGRVYLVYPDEKFVTLAQRRGGLKMSESEAIGIAIQVCQAVSFLNRRALRLNDICPQSIAYGADGRIKLLGLDYVSNDNELQSEPIFNDGYTAPEIYRGKRVDKRADVFSIGALLYSCLTGERLESESWREEAGAVRFYPPHAVSPELEQAVRRSLVFDPAGRWPTVDALKAELVRLNSLIRIRSAAMTDVGMVREHNEDAAMAVEYVRETLIDPAQHYLYVVADGMGGAEAGEVAAAIAVDSIRNYVQNGVEAGNVRDLAQVLTAALEEANRQIIEYQAAHPESRGMGSTAVGVLLMPPEGALAWVGDSRIYLSDAAGLRQLTRDHSLVQRLIEIGQITPEEARHHEHKNVITRSLGARQSGPAGAEGVPLRLKRGDRVLLCSDGLTAHVDDRSIGEILRRHEDPSAAARELVVAANAGGGTDNVTVIVIFAD
jgi:PPM family protein phosphatase